MDDAAISNNEILANFIFDSNKFRTAGVHHRALMPNPKHGNKSAFRVSGLSAEEIAELGTQEVATGHGRPHLGWAQLLAEKVRNAGLHLRVDEPPARHAVIENWPVDVAQQRELALQLAADAITHRWPAQPE